MKFSIFQESRIGGRKANQDRIGYTYSRESLMMVVADGMGGHLHGEVAAQITVQHISEAFQREATPILDDPSLFLRKAIIDAHLSICSYAKNNALKETPRTTCVACIVQDGFAYWAHVGDSRLYHLRDGRIVTQTKDHSQVQRLVDQGRIREESVANHPDRNKIYNCLGAHVNPHVELSRKALLLHGDVLLLCSDGLWGPLSGTLISGYLMKRDILKAVPELMNQAELRAGKDCDNLSVVAMTWAEDTPVLVAGEVSTQTLELGAFEGNVEDFNKGNPASAHADLSDEEIERAIEEIRTALRNHAASKPSK
jgi:serine/threonine protein phosphatase PrpC